MNTSNRRWDDLIDRARHGDTQARVQFRKEFEPQAMHSVRCALTTGSGPQPWAQHWLAEARRAGWRVPNPNPPDYLVRSLARQACAALTTPLPVTTAPSRWSADTVVA
jgi:hypothetical protein